MNRKRYGFSGGPYSDDSGRYSIEGSFIILPLGSADCAAPEYTVLSIIYNAVEEASGVSAFFSDRQIYILINDQIATIGDIMNQQPLPYNHPFFHVLKEIVMAEYDMVKVFGT